MEQRISALQIDGQRVEFMEPNLTLSYAALAPIVSKAWAFFQSGHVGNAKKAIEEAQAVIEATAKQFEFFCILSEERNHDENNGVHDSSGTNNPTPN